MVLEQNSKIKLERKINETAGQPLTIIVSLTISIGLVFGAFMMIVPLHTVGGDDAQDIEPLWSYQTGDRYRQISTSNDGKYFAAGSYDNKVYLFEQNSSEPLWTYTTGNDVTSIAISGDGEYIVAGTDDPDRTVYLFHRENSAPLWTYKTDDNGGHGLSGMSISDDGEYIAVGANDKVLLFDKDNSVPLWMYDSGSKVFQTSISGDGEYITACNINDNIYLWKWDNSTPVWSYKCGDDVWDVEISSDSNFIVAGGKDDNVYLFDRTSSTPLWTFDAGVNIHSVHISGDGQYITAGSSDSKVYLFEKSSSTPEWSHTVGDIVTQVDISEDGEYIAACSLDGNVYLFAKDSSTPYWIYSTSNNMYAVTISADGYYIGAGAQDTGDLYFFTRNQFSLSSSEEFYQEDLVVISASYQFGPVDITILVKDPDSSNYHADTLTTDANGDIDFEFLLDEEALVGEWTVIGLNDNDDRTVTMTFTVLENPNVILPFTRIKELSVPDTIQLGEDLSIEFIIESTYRSSQTVTFVFQLKDPSQLPLTPVIVEKTIPAEDNTTFTLNMTIPEDGEKGSYTVKCQLLSDGGDNLGSQTTEFNVTAAKSDTEDDPLISEELYPYIGLAGIVVIGIVVGIVVSTKRPKKKTGSGYQAGTPQPRIPQPQQAPLGSYPPQQHQQPQQLQHQPQFPVQQPMNQPQQPVSYQPLKELAFSGVSSFEPFISALKDGAFWVVPCKSAHAARASKRSGSVHASTAPTHSSSTDTTTASGRAGSLNAPPSTSGSSSSTHVSTAPKHATFIHAPTASGGSVAVPPVREKRKFGIFVLYELRVY